MKTQEKINKLNLILGAITCRISNISSTIQLQTTTPIAHTIITPKIVGPNTNKKSPPKPNNIFLKTSIYLH